MKILKVIKENLFISAVAITYLGMFIFIPKMGIDSIESSLYYIKEMLMIMPVVFVLTALLDLWIPKEKIEKHLGNESKTKGILLSLVLGSVSAGPIYAAFPFCVMLLKKGASIKNIIIILSSWAVIKIPMLTIETKFLGLKFMIVRYILTIIAIIIFSSISSRIVKKSDIPTNKEKQNSDLEISAGACMGCCICAKKYPELFFMKNKKAHININFENINIGTLESIIKSCPVNAIQYDTIKK